MRKGFSIESVDLIKTKSQLKDKITSFSKEASSIHIKCLLEKMRQYDFGTLNLYFKIILDCRDDPYLEHYKSPFKSDDKIKSCAYSFYAKDEFWERLEKICIKHWDNEPDYNNSRSNFSINYHNDNFHLKEEKS